MKKMVYLFLMFMPALAIANNTGWCGDHVTYRFDNASQTLYISGQGKMYDYASSIPIAFELSSGGTHTRGVESSNSSISEFEVWAFKDRDNTLYMGDDNSNGRIVSRSGEKWVYNPVQPWTSGGLSFISATPSNSLYFTNKKAESENGVSLAYDIHIPADVKKQEDLMIAVSNNVPKPETYKPVNLDFKHVLSEIVFKSKVENKLGYNNNLSGIIKEISLVNIYADGHLTYNGKTQISNLHNNTTYTLVSSDFNNDDINGTLTSTRNNDKRNSLFILPQLCKGGGQMVRPGEPKPADGKTYLKIRARIESQGYVLLNGDETDAFYLPLGMEFNPGIRYTFCFIFSNTGSHVYDVSFSMTAESMENTNSETISFNIVTDGTVSTRGTAVENNIRPWEEYKKYIENIIVGEGVTYIGEYTFDGLENLKSVVLPSSLKEIGRSSFNECTGLLNIYCYATRVPEYAESGFNTDSDNCKLHVPTSAVDSYKQYFDGIYQENGSKYFRYIDALQDGDPVPTSVNTIRLAPDNGQVLTISGQRVVNPKPGVYIQRGRKVIIK